MVELLKDFAKAQEEFPEIKKDKEGQEGHRKFKYANLNSILKACVPVLAKHNMAIVQRIEKGETPDSLILITELWHTSGEKISSSMPLPDPLAMKAKEFGGFVTYYRRYALAPILGIEADEDLDANTEGPGNKQKGTKAPCQTTNPKPTPRNHAPTPQEALWAFMKNKGWTAENATKVCNMMFNKGFKELTEPEIQVLKLAVESKTAAELMGEQSE